MHGRSPKWTLVYSNVAVIEKKINDAMYVVKFEKTGHTLVVHVDKLKPYLEFPADA